VQHVAGFEGHFDYKTTFCAGAHATRRGGANECGNGTLFLELAKLIK